MRSEKSIVWRSWEWLDGRYQLGTLMDALLHVAIPRTARTYYLGGITMFLFIVQAITGILLSLYYQPAPEAAYDSILFIMNEVNFGWLIRSVHAWGANLMILFCVLHLLRIFFQGAYEDAEVAVQEARGVGMLVAPMEGRLREASTSLITARAAQHTLDVDSVRERAEDAQLTAEGVKAGAAAVAESIFRRQAMVAAVAVIGLTIVALYLLKRELDRRLDVES